MAIGTTLFLALPKLPDVLPCKECGKRPKYTKAKGKRPTTVYCKRCDCLASSGHSPKGAIEIWNRMNRKES